MARSRSCSTRTISFKTKRGKRVSFKGRPTGFGSNCSPAPKRTSSAQRAVRTAFKKAAQKCEWSKRSARNKCVKKLFRQYYK